MLTARDAFTLLFGWESLTLAFWLLAGFDRRQPGRPAAALVTLAFGRDQRRGLLAGLLLLVTRSGSLALAAIAHVPPGPLRATACVLLLAGFAVKVGLVPFQVWLPRGYAAAPGPAQADHGRRRGQRRLLRTVADAGPARPAAVRPSPTILLVLASLTAVLGIAHAAVQTSLQRVIAYSSVENTGLILAGFGVALVGAANRQPRAGGGRPAGRRRFRSSRIPRRSRCCSSPARASRPGAAGDDLDDLRGSARLVPWSGTGLAIGSLTLAGLPPTAGFVSEWFLLEALMQQFRVPGLGDRLVLAVTGAAVALTAGFAGVTFVRLVGLVVLGKPRHDRCASSDAIRSGGRAGMVVLAVACLAVAALTPLEIRVIAAGLIAGTAAAAVTAALKSPWVLQPVFAGFSILSPSWLWVVMPSLFARGRGRRLAGVGAAAAPGAPGPGLAVGHGRRVRPRTAIPHSDSPTPPAGCSPRSCTPGLTSPGSRRARPTPNPMAGRKPCRRPSPMLSSPPMSSRSSRSTFTCRSGGHSGCLVRAAQRLQSGRLDAYLAYMLIALIAVLAAVTALH